MKVGDQAKIDLVIGLMLIVMRYLAGSFLMGKSGVPGLIAALVRVGSAGIIP